MSSSALVGVDFIKITEYDLPPGKSLTAANSKLNTDGKWELRAVKKGIHMGLKNNIFFSSAIGLTFESQEIAESTTGRNMFSLKMLVSGFSKETRGDQ